MSFDVFFWYVFPLIIAAGSFGWIAYDKWKERTGRKRLHPGE